MVSSWNFSEILVRDPYKFRYFLIQRPWSFSPASAGSRRRRHPGPLILDLVPVHQHDLVPFRTIWQQIVHVPTRAPQDVDVLAVLDIWISSSRPCSRREQPSFRAWWADVWDNNQESQNVSKVFENPGRRGRPLEAWSLPQLVLIPSLSRFSKRYFQIWLTQNEINIW